MQVGVFVENQLDLTESRWKEVKDYQPFLYLTEERLMSWADVQLSRKDESYGEAEAKW